MTHLEDLEDRQHQEITWSGSDCQQAPGLLFLFDIHFGIFTLPDLYLVFVCIVKEQGTKSIYQNKYIAQKEWSQ